MVLEPAESVTTCPDATSELYHVLGGRAGRMFESDAGPAAGPAEAPSPGAPATSSPCPPAAPAGTTAGTGARALLYRVTDAPLLAYLGVTPGPARFAPTRYDAATALARLAEVEAHPDAATRNRVSILLGNAAQPQTLTVTHTLWAMLGVLPADRVQRPHRHQSVALDLITDCAPGCFTLVGREVDDRGAIVDPVRVDWETAGAFVTPPGLWHSHHNESGRPAQLVPDPGCGAPHLPALPRHPVRRRPAT